MWYLIVSIPNLCRLSYFLLASHRYCSTHCVEVVYILEKKLNCKNYHFQELCFSKVSNVQCIIWKTSLVIINPDKSMPDNYGKNLDCDTYCSVIMTLPMCGSRGGYGVRTPPLENSKVRIWVSIEISIWTSH